MPLGPRGSITSTELNVFTGAKGMDDRVGHVPDYAFTIRDAHAHVEIRAFVHQLMCAAELSNALTVLTCDVTMGFL